LRWDEPQGRPRYTLDELPAQCDASAELSGVDREWLQARPVGAELPSWPGDEDKALEGVPDGSEKEDAT